MSKSGLYGEGVGGLSPGPPRLSVCLHPFPRPQTSAQPRSCFETWSWSAGDASRAGDVFSLGIIMQEVVCRSAPYAMLELTPEGTAALAWCWD